MAQKWAFDGLSNPTAFLEWLRLQESTGVAICQLCNNSDVTRKYQRQCPNHTETYKGQPADVTTENSVHIAHCTHRRVGIQTKENAEEIGRICGRAEICRQEFDVSDFLVADLGNGQTNTFQEHWLLVTKMFAIVLVKSIDRLPLPLEEKHQMKFLS